MKNEESSGGLVVQKRTNGWYVLVIKDMNGAWTFPKGIIEKGETPKDAARREIAEEASLRHLTFIASLSDVEYFYKRNGRIHKTVHYFLFQSQKRQRLIPQKEEGIQGVQWKRLATAAAIIGYPETNTSLLQKTQEILTTWN